MLLRVRRLFAVTVLAKERAAAEEITQVECFAQRLIVKMKGKGASQHFGDLRHLHVS